MRLGVLISIAAASLWACGGGGEPSRSGEDEFTLPSPSGGTTKSFPVPGSSSVTGRLAFDEIEGGCWFVQSGEGVRYEVIYPEGWVLDRLEGVLHGPDGEMARAGDAITVRGAIARDRSSLCQIGPIFEATEVEVGPG